MVITCLVEHMFYLTFIYFQLNRYMTLVNMTKHWYMFITHLFLDTILIHFFILFLYLLVGFNPLDSKYKLFEMRRWRSLQLTAHILWSKQSINDIKRIFLVIYVLLFIFLLMNMVSFFCILHIIILSNVSYYVLGHLYIQLFSFCYRHVVI